MSRALKDVYLVANWKSHKNYQEAFELWLGIIGEAIRSKLSKNRNIHAIICPPDIYLMSLNQTVIPKGISLFLGIQNISSYPFGAYTGEINASMVKGIVAYAIVGHSERRRYLAETNTMVAQKVRQLIDNQIIPIVCVDEPYMVEQLECLEKEELNKIIVAYEPLSAIGSGLPDSPLHADNVAKRIKNQFETNIGVLYGGSVSAGTVKSFIDMPNVDGVLVGSASLDVNEWNAIVNASLQ